MTGTYIPVSCFPYLNMFFYFNHKHHKDFHLTAQFLRPNFKPQTLKGGGSPVQKLEQLTVKFMFRCDGRESQHASIVIGNDFIMLAMAKYFCRFLGESGTAS